jgi:hypothetical protein
MKNVIYVLCAITGFALAAAGSSQIAAQIQEQELAKARANSFPAAIERLFSQGSSCPTRQNSAHNGMVPVETVVYLLFGYILQVVGCAVYAESRGRSVAFGLLGLLSPIGYVFLALLNPVPHSDNAGFEVSNER